MPPPIGRSNSLLGAGLSRSAGIERTRNAKNDRRVDVVRTSGNSDTTTTRRSKEMTDAKGRTHTKQGKSETTANGRGSVEQEYTSDPLLTTDEKTLLETKAIRLERKGQGPAGFDTERFVEGPKFLMTGTASLNTQGLGAEIDVNLKVDANLIRAGASATREFKFKVNGEDVSVQVKLGAEGNVGLNGELNLRLYVGKDGIKVSADAEGFAGARGTLSGSLEVGINGKKALSGDLSVTAAAGAGAAGEFELARGSFKARAYAAVGVGVGVAINGTYSTGTLLRGGAALALPASQGWN